MTELTTYMLIKGTLSLLLICGGIYALKKGFELYITGVGLKSDSLSLSSENKIGKINISLKRVGTVVMLTSVIWASLGYFSIPNGISQSTKLSNDGTLELSGNVNSATIGLNIEQSK